MAEPVGLAIGVVGLAGLLSTCIDCMDLVTLERNYGKDLEISLTKLALLNCRLNIWATGLRVQKPGHESRELRNRWSEVSGVVGKSLIAIKTMFDDKKELEKTYGLRELSTDQTIATMPDSSSAIQEIERSFKISIRRRQKETSLARKTWWAVHDKKKFDILIGNAESCITSLERISDSINASVEKDMFRECIAKIQSSSGRALLQDAEAESYGSSSADQTSSDGHKFVRMLVMGKGRAIEGNVGWASRQHHSYESGTVKDNGKAIHGDTSAAAMEAFFK